MFIPVHSLTSAQPTTVTCSSQQVFHLEHALLSSLWKRTITKHKNPEMKAFTGILFTPFYYASLFRWITGGRLWTCVNKTRYPPYVKIRFMIFTNNIEARPQVATQKSVPVRCTVTKSHFFLLNHHTLQKKTSEQKRLQLWVHKDIYRAVVCGHISALTII